MNTGRHLNDVFARRSLTVQPVVDENNNSHEEEEEEDNNDNDYEGEINIDTERRDPPAPKNTTLMDMLMNGDRTTTTTITVGGSSNVSPAVLDYMRVTSEKQQGKGPNTNTTPAVQADSIPLEDMFETRYAERIARICNKIEKREVDEYDEVDEEEEDDSDDSLRNHGHNSDDIIPEEEDEDDAMMRELMGIPLPTRGRNQSTQPPSKKKQRTTGPKATPPTKDSCFLCQFGDRFHDGIRAPHIARLVQIIDKLYGKMSNYDLANAVHLYYMKYIYNEDEGTSILEAHVVLEHIEGRHSLAALNFIVESIHDYERVKFIAKGSLCKADGSMDHRVFAIFDKAQTKLEKLYTMNIEKMNFNNGQTIEDLNSKGAYFNLMPMFSQKEEHYRRLKRKASAIESATNTFDF